MTTLRVGLLGGSFDPLHVGHLMVASSLLWRREPDALWLLPVARHRFEKVLSSFDDRLAMAQIAARLLGPRTEARDTERQLADAGGDGSTVELLRQLTLVHPTTEFLLVLGADAWAQRAAWREFEALGQLCEPVVFNRCGTPEVPGAGPALPAVSSTEIRDRIRAGQSIDELVPAEIARYIRARDLYR